MNNIIYETLLEEKNFKIKGRLYHYTQVNMAYNTNRIEGSKLSEDQTRSIFETQTLLPEDSTPIKTDDIIETQNHFKAFDYMLDIAEEPLTEEIIKTFHWYIKHGTSQEKLSWFRVGDYKIKPNTIGDLVTTTSPEKVHDEMDHLLYVYEMNHKKTVEDLIDFHYHFEKIHPFQDGNGRVGRLILFKECLRYDIVPFVIDEAHELFYKRGLQEYSKESGYLIDTCLSCQDNYKIACETYGILYSDKTIEKQYDIKETIINSKARMTYTEVSDILEHDDEELKAKYSHVVEEFKIAEVLAKILMERRNRRGAIDFDFPEAKIILTPEGKVSDIKEYERRISNRIIEEFMLITNETVAEHYFWLNIPFVYRIHETPSPEKMQELGKFVSTFGYTIKGDLEEVHPKALQSIISAIKGKKEEEAISTIMLRSLKQARYSPECSGHFGLAAQYYSHFTSPIRRYPDLQIHRIMKEHLNNKINKKRQEQLVNIVDYASTQSSERERAADLAERDVKDYYKAVYMEDKVGEEFDGVVSSVTSFGMFIELPNTVEGLSRLANMGDDYYIYDEMTYTIIGERTRKTYRIGDPVRIKVANVNVDLREIDFKILYKLEDRPQNEGEQQEQPFDDIEE